MMAQGFVYVMTNPSMPGLVKVGRTTRGVEQRASELWTTGVPTPFVVFGYFLAPDCEALEMQAHAELSEFRVRDGREFFRTEPEFAAGVVGAILRDHLNRMVSRFGPFTVISGVSEVAVECINSLCEEHNITPNVAVRAIRKVDAAALVAAIEDAAEQEARAKEEMAMFGPEPDQVETDDWW